MKETARINTRPAAAWQIFRAAGLAALDAIMPPRCLNCGEAVERQGAVCGACFTGLNFITAPLCACCGMPFEFAIDEGAVCAECASFPPPFTKARSALVYDEGSRSLLIRLKHDSTHGMPAFGRWLARSGGDLLTQADMITPVPLHPWRLWTRRYNQSALLALALGKATRIRVIPDLLRRTRATPSQAGRNRDQRRTNVRRAFAVRRPETVKDANILLIDDVYTTGATVAECARVLLAAGAARVDVLTLARVVRAA